MWFLKAYNIDVKQNKEDSKMENLFATRTVSLGIMPKEIDFNDDERYYLRSFTSLDGRELNQADFHIANLNQSQIFEIVSPDTDLENYRYFMAICPNGSIVIFQDLKYKAPRQVWEEEIEDDEDDEEYVEGLNVRGY
jgi:hypothetical protein